MKTITSDEYYSFSFEEKNNFTGIVTRENEGVTCFYKNGFLHREDGPAYINRLMQYEQYVQNNKLHREDGPAIIERNQYKEYWINDEQLENCNSDEALQLYIDMLKLKGINYKP